MGSIHIIFCYCVISDIFFPHRFPHNGFFPGQNVLATKDGQASRQALLTKKGSPERRRIIWKLLWYTFIASLLGTVHTLLVIGANVYILLALLAGNLAGVYFSYRQQQADEHDASADLCAVLRLAREHPDDEKWGHLRKDLRVFLQLSAPPTTPAPTTTPTSPLELDYSCRSASRSLRARPAGTFAPYSDHPPSHSTEVTEEWAL